jgi:hypothetical protein
VFAVRITVEEKGEQKSERNRDKEKSSGQKRKVNFFYKYPGLRLESSSGDFSAKLNLRIQTRLSHPWKDEPTSLAQLERPAETSLNRSRARVKLGGNLFGQDLDYYLEHDLVNNFLLDLKQSKLLVSRI